MKRHEIRVLAVLLVLCLMGEAAHAQTATPTPQTLQSMQQELQRMQDMMRELERQINLQQRATQGQGQRGGATAGQAGNGDALNLLGVIAGFQQQPGQRGGGGRGAAPANAPNQNDSLNNPNGAILNAERVRRVQVSPDGTVLTAYSQTLAAGGAWWTNTALLTRLGLTDDQKLKIERVYESHRQNLVSSKDSLEKEEAQLAKLLEADPLDRTSSVAQIYKVVQARGEMEKTNSLMTLEMREVLTRAQWTQLQAQQPLVIWTQSPSPAGLGLRGGGGGLSIATPFGVAPTVAPAPAGTGGQRGARGQ